MKKDSLKTNWAAWSAFGDPRYNKAVKNNNKKRPGKKKNTDAGIIGRAGLIPKTSEDRDWPKMYHKKNSQAKPLDK